MNFGEKGKFKFSQPEPVNIYTDINKSYSVGDPYLRLLTFLHFQLNTVYHRFDYLIYKPVEQCFIESISIRLFMKIDVSVLFEFSDIPCLVIMYFKRSRLPKNFQYDSYN